MHRQIKCYDFQITQANRIDRYRDKWSKLTSGNRTIRAENEAHQSDNCYNRYTVQ